MNQAKRTQHIKDLENGLEKAQAELTALEVERASIEGLLDGHSQEFAEARANRLDPTKLVDIRLKESTTKQLLEEQHSLIEKQKLAVSAQEAELLRQNRLAQLAELADKCAASHQEFEGKIAQIQETLEAAYQEVATIWNAWTDARAQAAPIITALARDIPGSKEDDYNKQIVGSTLKAEGVDVAALQLFYGVDHSFLSSVNGNYWTNNQAAIYSHGERKGHVGNFVIAILDRASKARQEANDKRARAVAQQSAQVAPSP